MKKWNENVKMEKVKMAGESQEKCSWVHVHDQFVAVLMKRAKN
jgi:hypothetical protein